MSGWADEGHGNLSPRFAYGLPGLIQAGLLAPGSPLPPERRLAEEFAVSRSTVTAALDLLRADGALTSRQGRGTFVAGPADADEEAAGQPHGRPPRRRRRWHRPRDRRPGRRVPPAACVIYWPTCWPAAPARVPAARVAGAATGDRRHAHRDRPRDPRRGVPRDVRRPPGDRPLARGTRRAPGADRRRDARLPGFFDIIEGSGPVAALRADRAGIVPESLVAALGEGGADRLRPGRRPDPDRRGDVAGPPAGARRLLDEHDATVIEDATLAELVFAGRPSTDLARLCRRARVVSIGSFSKVLWAGCASAGCGPNAGLDRTLHRRLAQDLGPATLCQLLTLALLPHLPEITARRRTFLAERRAGRGAAAGRVPQWSLQDPAGGSALSVDTGLKDTDALVQVDHRHGVHLAPGRSPSRAGAPTRTCASASTGRGRWSTPGCDGSAWHGRAGPPSPHRRIAGRVGRRAACPTRRCHRRSCRTPTSRARPSRARSCRHPDLPEPAIPEPLPAE